MTNHFGVFQFKEGITEEQIDECFAEMRAMVGVIPGLLSMEHGPYKSDEGLSDGYTHGFIMTFDIPTSLHRIMFSAIVLPVKPMITGTRSGAAFSTILEVAC